MVRSLGIVALLIWTEMTLVTVMDDLMEKDNRNETKLILLDTSIADYDVPLDSCMMSRVETRALCFGGSVPTLMIGFRK